MTAKMSGNSTSKLDSTSPRVHALIRVLLLVIALGTPLAIAREYLMPFANAGVRAFPDANTYLAAGERLNAGHELYRREPGDREVLFEDQFPAAILSPPPIAGGDDTTSLHVTGVDVQPAIQLSPVFEGGPRHDASKEPVAAAGDRASLIRIQRSPRVVWNANDDTSDGAFTFDNTGVVNEIVEQPAHGAFADELHARTDRVHMRRLATWNERSVRK